MTALGDRHSREPADDLDPVPGGSIGGGRFRLLDRCDSADRESADRVSLWHASDRKIDREVALTVIDIASEGDARHFHAEVLRRTVALCRDHVNGIVPIFDVVSTRSRDIVVSGWVPSTSFEEGAEGLRGLGTPADIAAALLPVAEAASYAHAHGVQLSLNRFERVRVSEGKLYVAFPSTPPGLDEASDIRGLGGLLDALIDDGTAERSAEFAALRELSDEAASAGTPHDICGATSLSARSVARRLRAVESEHVSTAPAAEPEPEHVPVPTEPAPVQALHRPGRFAAVSIAFVAALGAVGWYTGTWLTAPGTPAVEEPTMVAAQPVLPIGPLIPTWSGVYSPEGVADNVAGSPMAADARMDTAWRTDSYRQQFPAYKSGVGLILGLPADSILHAVWVGTAVPGTQVEIRSAPPEGGKLQDTTVLGEAVLDPGVTTIPLANPQELGAVTVWITRLAGAEGMYRSEISEIGFTGTAG